MSKSSFSRPKISILVPVYNNEEYLPECLESLARQTMKDLEIILIDDGSSSERTIELLEDFNKRHPASRLLHKNNTGYGHSLNMGIDMACGEYIGIVESDDFIHPRMYELLYRIAESGKLDLVKSDLAYFIDYKGHRLYETGRIHKKRAEYNRVLVLGERLDIFRNLSLNQPGIYRKSFLRDGKIRFNESPGASYQDNGFFFS